MDGDCKLAVGAAGLAGDAAGADPQEATREHVLDDAEDAIGRQIRLVEQQPEAVLDGLRKGAEAKGEVFTAAQPELSDEIGDGRVGRHVEAEQRRVGAARAKRDRGRLATGGLALEQHRLRVLVAIEQPRDELRHRVGHDEARVGRHAQHEVGPPR